MSRWPNSGVGFYDALVEPGEMRKETLKIFRIEMIIEEGNSAWLMITEDSTRVFSASLDLSPLIAFLATGEEVDVEYEEPLNDEKPIKLKRLAFSQAKPAPQSEPERATRIVCRM